MKNKQFDAVAWMRKRRADIYREDKDLSWEAKSKKTLSIMGKDPIWTWLKDRRIKAESHVLKHPSENKTS